MKFCDNCNRELKKIKTRMGVQSYICPKCKVRVLDDYNPSKSSYNKLLDSVSGIRIHNNHLNISAIKQMRDGDISGFEVGCANGLFMQMAGENGIRMSGIEPMHDSYILAKDQGQNVINGFFPDDMPEKLAGFDFIIFNDVFEHIRNSGKVIQYCKKCLREDGLLIINLPVSTGVIFRIGSLLDFLGKGEVMRRLWQIDTASPHVYYYNTESIKYVAGKYGFRLKRTLRMKTFILSDVWKRIDAIDIEGISLFKKIIYFCGAYVLAPFMFLLPSDLVTYYFEQER